MKLLQILLISLILISCKKDITLIDGKIKKLDNTEINKAEQTKTYLNDYYLPLIQKRNVKKVQNNSLEEINYSNNNPRQKKEKIIQESKSGVIKSEKSIQLDKKIYSPENIKIMQNLGKLYDADKELQQQIEEENKKEIDNTRNSLFKIDKTGIEGSLSLENNTNQNLEKATITTLITYKFPNKQFFYYSPYEILQNKDIWNINEKKDISIDNIFSYAYDYEKFRKILEVHKPEKIEIIYFISFSNSIGYSNYKKKFIYENSSPQIRNQIQRFGTFREMPFSKEDLQSFGEKILENDLTELLTKK
ncbi:hypothetical protein [Epilithonimonas xixisoli]|uniref:Uncharacterized protein n=1 Tax=Epilithonimonas xixisoli TaxID=1476462 RepID=A0A4R8IF27_9FLAO|nr:hypothetical protein [Epilithonimonas xixisoli]TDX84024.1 hypothetical protein B0I22_1616 [Epilithonimonas xixisoli]